MDVNTVKLFLFYDFFLYLLTKSNTRHKKNDSIEVQKTNQNKGKEKSLSVYGDLDLFYFMMRNIQPTLTTLLISRRFTHQTTVNVRVLPSTLSFFSPSRCLSNAATSSSIVDDNKTTSVTLNSLSSFSSQRAIFAKHKHTHNHNIPFIHSSHCYFSTSPASIESVSIERSSSPSPSPKDSTNISVKKVTKKAPKMKDPVSIFDAINLIKKNSQRKPRKFDETVDIAIVLGVDTRKANQTVRAVQDLPHGSGKKVRVGVFAKNEDAESVKNMGWGDSVIVGSDDLVKRIQGGEVNFDRCVATPDCMPLVGRVARILGPRGLMPNPKLGTVTKDIVGAIKSALAGQVQFKADKFGMIHCPVGKVSFSDDALAENIRALMIGISNAKPEASKGKYIRKVHLSSTMGSGIPVDLTTVDPGSSRFFFKEKAE